MAKSVKMSGGKLQNRVRTNTPAVNDGRVRGGQVGRNGGYNVFGRRYSWQVEAQREIARGFRNDSRSFGRALRRGVNIRSF